MTLESGRHRVRVQDYNEFHVEGKSDYVLVTFADEKNETVEWRGYLSDAAFQYTSKKLEVLGIDWNKMFEKGFNQHSGCLPLNKWFDIDVVEEEFNGKTYAKVANIYLAKEGVENTALSRLKAMAQRSGKVVGKKIDLNQNLDEMPF